MIRHLENRRNFLRRAGLAAATFPFLLGCKSSSLASAVSDDLSLIRKNAKRAGAEGMGAIDAPDNVAWKTVLAKETDEGEPLIISGSVFRKDGKTPAPNVLIYLYHTNSYGFYGRKGEPKHGRFRGWMQTDAKGRFEFRSIRPASYPNREIAAHIHMTVTGKDFEEDWLDSILFEGDKLITEKERNEAGGRGGFNPIIMLEKDARGIWRGKRDIQLWQI